MSWRREQTPWGEEEVDENGYLRSAVEAWAEYGIYPPPCMGDPRRPGIVALQQAMEHWQRGESPVEREIGLREARRIADEHGWQHNLPTPASSSS